MNNSSLILKKHIADIEIFIKHNLENGNINEDSTINDLLILIDNIKDCYIPMCESIEEYASKIK